MFVLALLIFLTGVASYTALRIEYLNQLAGGFLPRKDVSKPDGTVKAWRVTSDESRKEIFLRQLLINRGDMEYSSYEMFMQSIDDLELSPSETVALENYVKKWRANRQLREVIDSFGLFQHLFVPAGIYLCFVLYRRGSLRLNIGVSCCLVILVACGVLMFYRQYFLSGFD